MGQKRRRGRVRGKKQPASTSHRCSAGTFWLHQSHFGRVGITLVGAESGALSGGSTRSQLPTT